MNPIVEVYIFLICRDSLSYDGMTIPNMKERIDPGTFDF